MCQGFWELHFTHGVFFCSHKISYRSWHRSKAHLPTDTVQYPSYGLRENQVHNVSPTAFRFCLAWIIVFTHNSSWNGQRLILGDGRSDFVHYLCDLDLVTTSLSLSSSVNRGTVMPTGSYLRLCLMCNSHSSLDAWIWIQQHCHEMSTRWQPEPAVFYLWSGWLNESQVLGQFRAVGGSRLQVRGSDRC